MNEKYAHYQNELAFAVLNELERLIDLLAGRRSNYPYGSESLRREVSQSLFLICHCLELWKWANARVS